ncbi:hypothetical protein BGW42_007452 [Actinomortierella wolfii]|nr:hypothetical protein BGW42_007452 [Actinomortierella wolfii]
MCVVTTNDYSNNVPSLGIASNYSLIKNIDGALSATDIVDNYLQLDSVKLKNKNDQLFLNSINVFIGLQQTPTQSLPDRQDSKRLDYHLVLNDFDRVRNLLGERRKRHRLAKEVRSADTWLPRHRPNQQFNPFRTIDMPPAVQGVSSRRTRPRYSFKVRRQAKVHAEPDALHQYQRKDWKVLPDRRDEPVSSTAVAKTKPLANPLPPYTQDLTRKPVLKALDSEHPIVTLEFGSLHKNIIGVLHDKPDVARSVEDCLRAVVRRANDAKRQFQRVIASYLEIVFSGEIQQHDRKFLNHLCENVRSQVIAQTAEDKKNEDITLGNTKQSSFIQAILVAMISGKDPPRGSIANEFIARLRGIGLINVEVPATVYPANIIAKSVSSQLCLQLKKHFKDGSVLLHQRVRMLYIE